MPVVQSWTLIDFTRKKGEWFFRLLSKVRPSMKIRGDSLWCHVLSLSTVLSEESVSSAFILYQIEVRSEQFIVGATMGNAESTLRRMLYVGWELKGNANLVYYFSNMLAFEIEQWYAVVSPWVINAAAHMRANSIEDFHCLISFFVRTFVRFDRKR